MIKKKSYVVVLYFFLNPLILYSNIPLDSRTALERAIDEDTFEATFTGQLDDFADDANLTPHLTRQAPSQSLLLQILGVAPVKNTLYATIFHRTHPLIERSINSLPLFQFFPDNVYNKKLLAFQSQLFANQISKAFYTKENSGINAYVNMDFYNELEEIDDAVLPGIRISRVFQLFDKVKVQERQIGSMFSLHISLSPFWTFGATIPLSYLERNFFLSADERSAIEKEDFFRTYGGDYIRFAQEHLIVDKVGIGDLVCYLEKSIRSSRASEMSLGLQATFPTAFSCAKGMIGTKLNADKPNPNFNLHNDFLNPYAENQENLAKKNAEDFFIGALDRLSTILLERNLGNDRHFAVGPYLRSHLIFKPHVTLTSKLSCEFFSPWQEKRFFKVAINKGVLDTIVNLQDATDAQAIEYIQFLSTLITDKLYLRPYDATILPGPIIQSTSRLAYRKKRWTLAGGTDFWFKAKEYLMNVHAPADVLPSLDIHLARKPFGLQNTLWFSLERNNDSGKYWDLSFKVASTTFSTGIGHSITLGFQLSHDF